MTFEPQSLCSSEEEHKIMERMLKGTSRAHFAILSLSQPIMSRARLKDVSLRLKFPMCNANLSCCNLSLLLFFSVDHEHEKGIIHFLFQVVFMFSNSISMLLFCLCL